MEIWMLLAATTGGYAACWFSKDKVLVVVKGAETYASELLDKAAKIKAAL
jgi:hypothetical protein